VSFSALLLILAAAVAHATWNLLAKRAGGGAVFVWLYAVTATALWAPVTIPVFVRFWPRMVPIDWVFMIGSGIIHTGYFLLLQRGYRTGDLSLVYPLARGTGPALSTVAAIFLFAERPTALALTGAALIIVSILMFSNPMGARPAHVREGILFGLAAGVLIAFYTLWDKHAVAALSIPPLLQEWFTSLTRAVCLLPLAWSNWGEVKEDWRTKRAAALWIGALNPLAYLLVLLAMTFSPVSYIAPAREVSILFGALFGAQFLKEGDRSRRLAAASVMVLGVCLLAAG
jgi:drug/metabolite transporter (DMT)-like permease